MLLRYVSMVRIRLVLACVVALACGRGATGSGTPSGPAGTAGPADAPAVPGATDAGVASGGTDGGGAGPQVPSFPNDPPDVGDLSLLTAAPPAPEVQTTCDAASVTPAPAGHHPGPCTTMGVSSPTHVFAVRDTYVAGRVATEQREEWASAVENFSYTRNALENTYDGAGRLQRITQRAWKHWSPHQEYGSTSWERTDYWYGNGAFSTQRIGTTHSGEIPGPVLPPQIIERDDFVIDALGTAIETRQRFPTIGGGFDRQVTFHANGVEASETWRGSDQWYQLGGNRQFDDAGHLLVEDFSSFRGGDGTGRLHVVNSYESGRLIESRIEDGLYSDWPGEPQLGGGRGVETYAYDSGGDRRNPRLIRVDLTQAEATCTIDNPGGGDNWVATCTWADQPGEHTVFAYDDSDNLIERTTTDDTGKELSRWSAVADTDGNLLCEKQTLAGVLASFSRYDYSCW